MSDCFLPSYDEYGAAGWTLLGLLLGWCQCGGSSPKRRGLLGGYCSPLLEGKTEEGKLKQVLEV